MTPDAGPAGTATARPPGAPRLVRTRAELDDALATCGARGGGPWS